jgi:hypothetical protein
LVAVSGCGGSESEYQQASTAECLRERGFVVRVGPRPTELTVYARHWAGTSHIRIGVLRFYESSAEAEQAVRQLAEAERSSVGSAVPLENERNVRAELWLRAGGDDWRSCLREA